MLAYVNLYAASKYMQAFQSSTERMCTCTWVRGCLWICARACGCVGVGEYVCMYVGAGGCAGAWVCLRMWVGVYTGNGHRKRSTRPASTTDAHAFEEHPVHQRTQQQSRVGHRLQCHVFATSTATTPDRCGREATGYVLRILRSSQDHHHRRTVWVYVVCINDACVFICLCMVVCLYD